MNRVVAGLELLRPRQWIKNGFVLVGLLFGHAWSDPQAVWAAVLATFAFCLASGATYALNDARDAEQDRRHPDKRDRPVARGDVSVAGATAIAGFAAAGAVALGLLAQWRVAAIIAAYLALNVGYSVRLKHVAVIDVVTIAAGFMLRLLAGTLGIGIPPSTWLIACGFLLTLFLGFAKRRAEMARLEEGAGRHRAVLEAYSPAFLDRAIGACAAGMVLAYAWYTLSEETARIHGTRWLVLTLPWVALGTLRYLYRLRRRAGGGDPTEELLRDPVLAGALAGWLGTVLWLIG